MPSQRQKAFTIIEVLVVLAISAILLVLLISAIRDAKLRAKRICCNCSLKQIGLAFRMWSNDHGEQFPWHVDERTVDAPNNDGAKLVDVSSFPDYADNNLIIFRSLSNELNTPKPLACQRDVRTPASTFVPGLTNSLMSVYQISYFVGLDARETNPYSILTGDRNVIGGVGNARRRFWTNSAIVPDVRFDSNALHGAEGNIGLGDGSVHQVNDHALQKQLEAALQHRPRPCISSFRSRKPRMREAVVM